MSEVLKQIKNNKSGKQALDNYHPFHFGKHFIQTMGMRWKSRNFGNSS